MELEKWIDITMNIRHDMMVYKDREEKRPVIEVRADHNRSNYHESSIHMDLHTGTHVDMPLHMLRGGTDSSGFGLSHINGISVVLDFKDIKGRGIEELDLLPYADVIESGDIVLLKTRNSEQTGNFDFEFVYLAESGARYLLERGIKAVGIDALGIERNQEGHPTHKLLLSNDIYIIEGLDLHQISGGRYHLLCLPLRIDGVEGLPCRALIKPE